MSENTGGEISISGAQYHLTNIIIAANGSSSSLFGGAWLDRWARAAGEHVFDFHTVAANIGLSMVPNGGLGICWTLRDPDPPSVPTCPWARPGR